MVDVTVIIVNYNTYQITKECIDSVFKYTKDISFEVILVDNNSHDESFNHFSNDNRIKYIYLPSNVGFGNANNVGFEHSKGKYLFLLNSDTILMSNAVKEFFDYLENATPQIACIGTMLRDKDNNITHSYGNYPNLLTGITWYSILGFISYKFNHKKTKYITEKEFVVDYITGADIFLRSEIAYKYGLFDPDFFMYFEETEMQYRYNKNGYKCVIYNKPQIIHLENYSMNNSFTNNFDKLSVSLKSYYLYLKKCKGFFKYSIFRLIYAFISPIWLIHPKYSLNSKLKFIKNAYII